MFCTLTDQTCRTKLSYLSQSDTGTLSIGAGISGHASGVSFPLDIPTRLKTAVETRFGRMPDGLRSVGNSTCPVNLYRPDFGRYVGAFCIDDLWDLT